MPWSSASEPWIAGYEMALSDESRIRSTIAGHGPCGHGNREYDSGMVSNKAGPCVQRARSECV
jgi:hypothetical protein